MTKIIFWTTTVTSVYIRIWQIRSTFTMRCSLNSRTLVYVDHRYYGNAVSRDPFVQWNRFQCGTKATFDKWTAILATLSDWTNVSVGTGVAETSGSTTQSGPRNAATTAARNVRRIFVRRSMPPCRLRRRKFDYEMMHSEVYLNKYVVSIAPFSTPACPGCSQNITYT